MKKILCIFLAFLFLTGCGESAVKKNKLEIYSVSDDTLLATVDDQDAVKRMVDITDWEQAEEMPEDLVPEYKILVYQEKTLLFGQDPNKERGYDLIETLTTYKDCRYIQNDLSNSFLENLHIPEDVLSQYYIMPEDVREELDAAVRE